jgi:hypothetical protein
MRSGNTERHSDLEHAREAWLAAAGEARLAQDELAATEALLRETAEENLALHHRARAAIESMNRELRRLQVQLKRLAAARE